MKKLLFLTISFLFAINIHSQIEAGIKLGMSSADLSDVSIVNIVKDGKEISISAQNADYGVHFGLYTRVSFLGFYLEPAVVFNSSSTSYKVDDFSESGVIDELKSETYRSIDIPVLFGTKFGFFRIQGGPVAHFYLDSVNDLASIEGYSKNFKESIYGFQAGVGLDLWKVRLDLNYEGNLSYFGDDITIDGQEYIFDDSPSRLVASLGLRF